MNEAPYNIATHNGRLTIYNPQTGNHRTFSIRTQPDDSKFAPGKRVLALLSGPDNENDYQSFAFVEDDGSVRLFRSKQDDSLWAKYADMVANPLKYINGASKAEYLFEGRCRRCNRVLTTPWSIKAGLGEVCAKKLGIRPSRCSCITADGWLRNCSTEKNLGNALFSYSPSHG